METAAERTINSETGQWSSESERSAEAAPMEDVRRLGNQGDDDAGSDSDALRVTEEENEPT